MIQFIRGRYRDVLTDSQGRVRWDSGWRPNLVVHQCNLLLAALMKRHRGVRGILYWAVGEGESDWDALCHSPRPDDTRLVAEIARQALTPDQIVYLDDALAPTETPTSRLEITAEFSGDDVSAPQSLREFGLFGGDATAAADSGFMVNHVIHPRIDLSPGDTLSRSLRLMFASGAVQMERLTGFGAALPVSSVDGVGDVYVSILGGHGIHSLGDLAKVDPSRPVGDIPPVKLREFRAKARLVMCLQVSRASLEPFADCSVSRFLGESPQGLMQPGVTLNMVQRLQEALANLQIALDDVQLQRIMLGDLINT